MKEGARFRGLLETEHLFHRTAAPHDPAGLGLPFRRTISHARRKERLEDHLELLRCYYNFVRPHRALTFGDEIRTPGMQAGLTTRPLTLSEIFPSDVSMGIGDSQVGTIDCLSLSMRRR